MLPREQAVRRHDRVLVVGNAQEDCVNRLVRKHLAVVAVGLNLLDYPHLRVALLDHLLAVRRALGVVLRDCGHDAAVGELLNARDVHRVRDAAVADNADVDFPVREETMCATAEKNRRRASCGDSGDKLPSIHFRCSLWCKTIWVNQLPHFVITTGFMSPFSSKYILSRHVTRWFGERDGIGLLW